MRTGSATGGPTSSSGEASGQAGRGRTEEVAAVEDRRQGLAEEQGVREQVDAGGGMGVEDEREEAVVGTHEEPAAGTHRDRPALRADARVHDRHEHGARREVPVRGVERERPGGHVVGGYLVGDVHERRLGAGGQDRALHGPHVVVLEAEVREEGDDGVHAGL